MGFYSTIPPIDTDGTLGSNSDLKIPSQKAAKTYADNVLARPPATYGIGYRPRNLSAWYSAFEAATTSSPIDVVVLGDSIASLSSPEYGSWPDHLGLLLNRQAGMYNASTLARQPAMYKGVNLTHNGTSAATGFGRTAISLTTGQTALYSGSADLTRVAIVYSTSTLAGNLVIRETDASGSILQTINCSGATSSGNIWEGAVSASTKAIHITATGGTAILEAVYPLVNNPVRVWNASLSGATSLEYVNQADRALNFIDSLNTAGTLKLVIIATCTNDSANDPVETTNEINQLITLVKGHTSATVAQVIQSQNAALTAAEINSLRLNAETLNIPTIDFARSLSDLTATGFDGVHPIPGASEQSMGLMAGVILGGDPYGTIIRELFKVNPTVTANTTALLGMAGPAFSLSGSMFMNENEPGNLQLSAVYSPASGVIHAGRRQNINSQTGTSYITNSTDKSKIIARTNSSASTHTWPQDSDQSIGIGTIIEVINSGTGAITHSAGTGATLSSGSSTLQSPKTKITGIKTAANTWFISNSSLSADTDGTLSANSDAFVPSQKAVKTYVDSLTNPDLISQLTNPIYIAHRGGSSVAPEQTMGAFRISSAIGADMIECDVDTLADGSLILMHDTTVNRTTDGTGNIAAYDAVSVKSLDASYNWPNGYESESVPLFDELLNEFGGKIVLCPEPKTLNTLLPMIQKVKARKLEKSVIFQATVPAGLTTITSNGCTAVRVFFSEPTASDIADAVSGGASYLCGDGAAFSQAKLQEMVAALPTWCYTVNTRKLRDTLLGYGITGFMSDQPHYLKRATAIRKTDSWRNSVLGHGLGTNGSYAKPESLINIGQQLIDDGALLVPTPSSAIVYHSIGEVSPIGNYGGTFTIEYDMAITSGTAGTSTGGGLCIAPDDGRYYFGGSYYPDGWQFYMRDNNTYTTFKTISPSSTSTMGGFTVSGTAYSVGQWIHMKLEFTSSQIKVTATNTTTGGTGTHTVIDSSSRGGYVLVGKSGTANTYGFKNLTITP